MCLPDRRRDSADPHLLSWMEGSRSRTPKGGFDGALGRSRWWEGGSHTGRKVDLGLMFTQIFLFVVVVFVLRVSDTRNTQVVFFGKGVRVHGVDMIVPEVLDRVLYSTPLLRTFFNQVLWYPLPLNECRGF